MNFSLSGSLKRELDKLTTEKAEIQRHYIMVSSNWVIHYLSILNTHSSTMRCLMVSMLKCTSRQRLPRDWTLFVLKLYLSCLRRWAFCEGTMRMRTVLSTQLSLVWMSCALDIICLCLHTAPAASSSCCGESKTGDHDWAECHYWGKLWC